MPKSIAEIIDQPLRRRYERLAFHQKRITLPFFPNSRQRAVAGDYDGFVRECQDCVMQGVQDLFHRTAGEVCAADRSGEEGVAGNQFLLGGEVEADAAFGVAGGVQDVCGERPGGDGLSG